MSWLPRNAVVVPIDFSDESFDAVNVGRELTSASGTLHLIHVLPELRPSEPGVIWKTVDDEHRSQHVREAISKRLGELHLDGVMVTVAFGDPAREIAGFAEKSKADLIVMPSRGKGGAIRVLLGSVAERVIHLAHCSVLVLRR